MPYESTTATESPTCHPGSSSTSSSATPQRIVTVTFHLVKTGWAVFRMFDECPFSLMLGHSH